MIIKNNTIISEYKNIYDLNNKKIRIPIFQRFYAWKEKEIIQFKDDLLKVMADQTVQFYFLDFIYYEEDDSIYFADGQQRIVTLNNLIKAILEVSKANNIQIDSLKLFNISYDIKANNDKYITHFTNYPTVPFKKVYLNLLDFVKKNIDRINDLIKVIKNNIFVFLKKCSNADDAFSIFQQINTGGKPLTKDEVIKTALDQYSKIYDISFNTSKIKDVRQSIISYYKLLSPNSDCNFDNMEIITFLKEHVTKDKETFKKFVNCIHLITKSQDKPIRFVINYINRSSLFDVVNILTMKEKDIEDSNYQNLVLLPLCMMSIVLTFRNGNPTLFRYLLNEIIEKIKSNVKPAEINNHLVNIINKNSDTWKINFDDFKNKLGDMNVSNNIKKAILILDVIRSNTSSSLNVNKINLEHIYPQKPNDEWARNGWPTSRQEQKELIDNIGNYLLLCSEVNKRLQNQYIINKKSKYLEQIKMDKSLDTLTNKVDFELFEKEREEYIYKRQNDIATIIMENFPLGKVLIKP